MTVLPADVAAELMDSGESATNIASRFGVSVQYASQQAKKGGYVSPARIVGENLPWSIDPAIRVKGNRLLYELRLHAKYMVAGDKILTRNTSYKLRHFHRELAKYDKVVDYRPGDPEAAKYDSDGFVLTPRREQDEDFIIKVRPGIRITIVGDSIWRQTVTPEAVGL